MTQIPRNGLWLGKVVLLLVVYLCLARSALAAGEVTAITSHYEPSTPFRYSVGAQTFTWGMGHNEIIDEFTYQGDSYSYLSAADSIEIRRVDRPGVTAGSPCAVFAERAADFTQLLPDFVADQSGSGNCDVAALLAGRVVNRGVLDVFSNTTPNPTTETPEPKNIERIDFIFKNGVVAPLQTELLDKAGHVASEKRGNNEIQMAAVVALDASGQPSAYGPLIRIHPIGCIDPAICYGVTPLSHHYSFFSSSALAPQGSPAYAKGSSESVAMAFVSLKALGIHAGQSYYGFSYFPKDVDASVHTLTDPATFPADTADNDGPGDGADIYGGMSGYFLASRPFSDAGSVVTAVVFLDSNENGVQDESESGVEAVTLTLYEDTDMNGVFDAVIDTQVGDTLGTNASGVVFVAGVPDGDYFLLLDENDTDLPPGIELPVGGNPAQISTPQAPGSTVNFAFIQSDTGPGPGGEVAPTANDDAYSVLQNTGQDLTVLDNDLNPAGGTLTIVETGGVSHGTVTIGDGVLYYQPEAGFVGSTAFVYVIEDMNGLRDSGTVSLEVTRYSDINNNMLNDFDECNCTDLSLITGIDGSGVGALGGSLLLLGCAIWYRRRKHACSDYPAGDTALTGNSNEQ